MEIMLNNGNYNNGNYNNGNNGNNLEIVKYG